MKENVIYTIMPKLYTKTGDAGYTSLYDGNRISKASPIFDVLGNIQELSAQIGLLCSVLPKDRSDETLRTIQSDLQDIGSNIAVINPKKKNTVPLISEEQVAYLEKCIDNTEKENTPLTTFILPGVFSHDAQSHVCAAVARRTERSLWLLDQSEENENTEKGKYIELRYVSVDPNIMQYMNRLSDFFFAYARSLSGCTEKFKK